MKTYTITKILGGLLSIAILFILINVLGIEGYALYIYIYSMSSVICLLLSLGVERFITLEMPKIYNRGEGVLIRRLFVMLLLIRLGVSISVGSFIFLLMSRFGIYEINFSVLYCAIVISFLIISEMISVLGNVLSIHKNVSVSIFISTLAKVCLACGAIYLNMDLSTENVVIIFSMVEFICFIPIVFMVFNRTGTKSDSFQIYNMSTIGKICFDNYKSLILSVYFMPMSVRMLVSVFFEPSVVASFSIVQTVVDRVRQYSPVFLFQNLVESNISKNNTLYSLDEKGVCTIKSLDYINSLYLLMFFLFGGYFINKFVSLATHGKIADVSECFSMLSIILLFSAKFSILWSFLNLSGKIVKLQKSMTIAVFLLVPTGLFFAANGMLWLYLLTILSFYVSLIIYFHVKKPGDIYDIEFSLISILIVFCFGYLSHTDFDYSEALFAAFLTYVFVVAFVRARKLKQCWDKVAKG